MSQSLKQLIYSAATPDSWVDTPMHNSAQEKKNLQTLSSSAIPKSCLEGSINIIVITKTWSMQSFSSGENLKFHSIP